MARVPLSVKYKMMLVHTIVIMIPIIAVQWLAFQALSSKLYDNVVESNLNILDEASNSLIFLNLNALQLEDKGNDQVQQFIFYGLANTAMGKDSDVIISNHSGQTLFSTNKHLASKHLHEQIFTSKEGKGSFTVDYLHVKRVVFYSYNAFADWYIIVYTPESSIMEKLSYIHHLMGILMLSSGIMCVVLIIILSIYYSGPIILLNRKMRQYATGKIDMMRPHRRQDEVEELEGYFEDIVIRLKESVNREYEMKMKSDKAKLLALQAQINPHFLHNALETINSIALIHRVPLISELARSLSQMFRYNIVNEEKLVTIDDELHHIEHYLKVQLIRFDQAIQTKIDIDPNVRKSRTIKFVLQPIVENSIVHGFRNIDKEGFINITGYCERSRVILTVRDSGEGMSEEDVQQMNDKLGNLDMSLSLEQDSQESAGHNRAYEYGIGIYNVNNRIKLAFGEQYGLTYRAMEEGLLVIITLPYQPEG
ncbi:histidine kinase [Paenibacillus algorifonticola]|uniref:sensor histidine kinase n=1 Tax=Paenibacillus algorifonticola TaxID=684063 RepID=UPI003D2C13B2